MRGAYPYILKQLICQDGVACLPRRNRPSDPRASILEVFLRECSLGLTQQNPRTEKMNIKAGLPSLGGRANCECSCSEKLGRLRGG